VECVEYLNSEPRSSTKFKQELKRVRGKKSGGKPSEPIGVYTRLLAFALISLLVIQALLTFILTRHNLTGPLPALNTLFAVLFGWVLSGLCICLLLYLWLNLKRVAAAVTLVLAILWVAGLSRYTQYENPVPILVDLPTGIEVVVSPVFLVVVLAIAIPALLALWFLQPVKKTLAIPLSLVWLFLWSRLVLGPREYLAGVVLLLSLVIGSTVFFLGLYLTSGFLLPLSEKGHRVKIFNFLRDYTLHRNLAGYFVLDEFGEDKVEERVPRGQFSRLAIGPGFILTDCNHAVAVFDGTEFKGVQGPGLIFTGRSEQIAQTFDLRPQLLTFPVQALTKDGIKIRVLALTPFKIDSRGRQPSLGDHLPYNKNAAHRAFLAQRMEHEGLGQTPERMKQRAWYDLPRIMGERILRNIISQYNFDDLYGPHQLNDEPPRKIIAKTFCEQLCEELKLLGIQLVGGGIDNLEPADPQVYVDRVHNWQADWERRITIRQAKGMTEWLRIVERARAEAQAGLILRLGRQLEELSTARTEFRPEQVLRQLVVILDELMGQPALKQMLPEDTLQGIIHIREFLAI
jgi:hypothetical protein